MTGSSAKRAWEEGGGRWWGEEAQEAQKEEQSAWIDLREFCPSLTNHPHHLLDSMKFGFSIVEYTLVPDQGWLSGEVQKAWEEGQQSCRGGRRVQQQEDPRPIQRSVKDRQTIWEKWKGKERNKTGPKGETFLSTINCQSYLHCNQQCKSKFFCADFKTSQFPWYHFNRGLD